MYFVILDESRHSKKFFQNSYLDQKEPVQERGSQIRFFTLETCICKNQLLLVILCKSHGPFWMDKWTKTRTNRQTDFLTLKQPFRYQVQTFKSVSSSVKCKRALCSSSSSTSSSVSSINLSRMGFSATSSLVMAFSSPTFKINIQ